MIAHSAGLARAARRGGNMLDKLQYAAAHALALSIPGVFLTILLTRMG